MAETVTLSSTTSPGLLASLDPLLREWLPRQRWFAGKGRPVTGFSLVAATELLPVDGRVGLYHLLVRAHQPLTIGAEPHPGDCYQLLIGVREALPPRLAPALIGHVEQGPLAGHTVYEALYDTRPAELLLEALRSQARIGGLRFEREPGREIRTGLVPRVVTAEQSNSSVIYGDTFILKLLRRVVPGVNPDLELPLALAREGCARVPAPTAWLRAELPEEQEPYVLGVLQPFLQGATDGWELALRELAKGEDFAAEARSLGRATAEVHTALARALPTVTLGHTQIRLLADGMIERLEAAAQAVPSLPHSAPAPAPDWADACRAAYCSGYAEVSGRDPRTDPVLLRAFETDKAIYEVLYEARHRPDWLSVPMAAIERYAMTDLT